MVAARRPEALPDGFAAELVSCVSGVGRRWGVTCPSRLTSPPETPSGESRFPSPLWAPVLRGGPRPPHSASWVFLVLPSRVCQAQASGSCFPTEPGPPTPGAGNREGRGCRAAAAWSLASRGFPDAPGRASERCKVLPSWPAHGATSSWGSVGGAVLSSSPRLTCGLCRLPGNLSQQAGWAGFAKQRGSRRGWVWAAQYTVSSLITHVCSLNSRHLGLWPLRAPAFPVSSIAWQRPGHVRPGAAGFGGSQAGGPAPMPARSPGPSFCGASHGEMWKLPVYLRPAFLCCLPHPTSLQKLPRGFWPLGPSWLEPFLAGVELVFILWEQPVLRSASPSPVVLVSFSLWRPQPSSLPRSRRGDQSGGRALGRKAEHHVASQNHRTLVEWWETPGSEGAG